MASLPQSLYRGKLLQSCPVCGEPPVIDFRMDATEHYAFCGKGHIKPTALSTWDAAVDAELIRLRRTKTPQDIHLNHIDEMVAKLMGEEKVSQPVAFLLGTMQGKLHQLTDELEKIRPKTTPKPELSDDDDRIV